MIINYYFCGEIAGGTSAGMLMYVIMLGKLVVCQNTYNFIWFLIYGGGFINSAIVALSNRFDNLGG